MEKLRIKGKLYSVSPQLKYRGLRNLAMKWGLKSLNEVDKVLSESLTEKKLAKLDIDSVEKMGDLFYELLRQEQDVEFDKDDLMDELFNPEGDLLEKFTKIVNSEKEPVKKKKTTRTKKR